MVQDGSARFHNRNLRDPAASQGYIQSPVIPFYQDNFLSLCSLTLCCHLGDDVRRYLSGPPGPQGPPGPPGASVGISASYSVEEIATYVYNIMNGRCRWHITVTLSLNVDQISQTATIVIFRERHCKRSTRSTRSSWSFRCRGLRLQYCNDWLLCTH